MNADGEQLQLKQFTAHAGKGTISASGTIGLGGGDLPVALQLTSHGAKPFASDLLTATIDMDLKLSGGLRSQLNATGSVQIDHADINIPNALPPDVVVLTVIRPGEKPAPVAKTPATIVMLNLTRDGAARRVRARPRRECGTRRAAAYRRQQRRPGHQRRLRPAQRHGQCRRCNADLHQRPGGIQRLWGEKEDRPDA